MVGESTWFATTCRECPAGCGMIVRNREGRAVKCEGNPLHPLNQGRLCALGQASLQGLYDPDRVQAPQRREANGKLTEVGWPVALREVGALLAAKPRLAIITDLHTGSIANLLTRWASAVGTTPRILTYEPLNYESIRAANGAVFGRQVVPALRLDRCDFVLSLGADFRESWSPSHVETAIQFAAIREPRNGKMAGFVYVGPRVSTTAAAADERILVPPGGEAVFGQALLAELGVAGTITPQAAAQQIGVSADLVAHVARALKAAKAPVVLGGSALPTGPNGAQTALVAARLNQVLRSPGLDFERPLPVSTTATTSDLRAFLDALRSREADLLLVMGANPAFSVPPELDFAGAIKGVKTVVSLSSYADETAAMAHWLLPASHPLESWGDYESQPGVLGIQQPTMGLVYNTYQLGDILYGLAAAAGVDPVAAFGAPSFHAFLRKRWAGILGSASNEVWMQAVRNGGNWPGLPAGAPPPSSTTGALASTTSTGTPPPRPMPESTAELPAAPVASAAPSQPEGLPAAPKGGELALWLYPHPHLHDGRGANKMWLQELPETITQVTWTSWVEMHPETARELGIRSGDTVRVTGAKGSMESPVLVWTGVAPNTVAIPVGQGHTAYGRYAKGRGGNAYVLLGAFGSPPAAGPALRVTTGSTSMLLARRQIHDQQHDRELARSVPIERAADIGQREEIAWPLPQGYQRARGDVYAPHSHRGHRWAMAVDMHKCDGCGACVVACYAENNVGVVGAEQVARGRIMSWLRIDRYFDGDPATGLVVFQPMLCQHCDAAPCEPVCPVFAAVHAEDGLNAQIYNRCVGTRYCNNNCPWKVRRFNWFDYRWPAPLNWQLNPDVTVRGRGVMEKCTFCVQRLRRGVYRARIEGRPLRESDVVPACVQTCAAGALVFGDLMDPNSRIYRLFEQEPRAYQMLPELNTKPAIVYLKRVTQTV